MLLEPTCDTGILCVEMGHLLMSEFIERKNNVPVISFIANFDVPFVQGVFEQGISFNGHSANRR